MIGRIRIGIRVIVLMRIWVGVIVHTGIGIGSRIIMRILVDISSIGTGIRVAIGSEGMVWKWIKFWVRKLIDHYGGVRRRRE